MILGLPVTQKFFPDIDQEKETGPNTLATGTPVYSRQIIYNNSFDDNLRVTYAVDVYADAASAHAAYQEAVDKSLVADGFNQLPDPGIGEESFAGTSGGGLQKHVGVGARLGNIVVGATRAGYDADPQTIEKIFFLTRLQLWQASILVPIYTTLGWFDL